jgi:hypothetical protein
MNEIEAIDQEIAEIQALLGIQAQRQPLQGVASYVLSGDTKLMDAERQQDMQEAQLLNAMRMAKINKDAQDSYNKEREAEKTEKELMVASEKASILQENIKRKKEQGLDYTEDEIKLASLMKQYPGIEDYQIIPAERKKTEEAGNILAKNSKISSKNSAKEIKAAIDELTPLEANDQVQARLAQLKTDLVARQKADKNEADFKAWIGKQTGLKRTDAERAVEHAKKQFGKTVRYEEDSPGSRTYRIVE